VWVRIPSVFALVAQGLRARALLIHRSQVRVLPGAPLCCLETSLASVLGHSSHFGCLWLVVAGVVEDELADEVAVFDDDSDVQFVDEHEDLVPAWARPTPMWWRRLLCRRVRLPLLSTTAVLRPSAHEHRGSALTCSARLDLHRTRKQEANKPGLEMPDKALASWRKCRAVFELALHGKSYDQIAREVGYANRGTAHRVVANALADRLVDGIDELREWEAARLDALQACAWDKAMTGDVRAVNSILKKIDRRCRLFGLYGHGPAATPPLRAW
jgi:hypothetical protein